MHSLALFSLILASGGMGHSNDRGRILLIRHGEKNGKARADGDLHLSTRGEIRAVALAQLLSSNNTDIASSEWSGFDIPTINTVVAQAATPSSPSYRKVETAEAIARVGGIELKVFDQQDVVELAKYLESDADRGYTSLVVWDHSTIGHLASQLLGLPKDSIRWPMDRYDVIWEIDLNSRTLVQFCQHLLYGDLWCELNPVQVYPATEAYRRSLNAQARTIPIMQ